MVTCQNERSQGRNRESAMKVLEARLLEIELNRQEEEKARLKGQHMDVSFGSQIRNYVLHPYKMVKDVRTDFETDDTIDFVAPFFARFSPLRILELFGIEFSELVLAAGVIVIPANFGSTAASQSVQVYINRHVPVVEQGGIFGLQQVQQNAFNLAAVFLLGLVATVTGPEYVFLVAPLVVGAAVLLMVRYSFRHAGQVRVERGEAARFLTEQRPEDEVIVDNQSPDD